MDSLSLPEGFKPKSFWDKDEGKLGMVAAIALLVGGLIGLNTILPFLISLAANTLYFGCLLGVIGLILYLVMNPKFRLLCSYMFQSAITKAWGIFIETNPIAVLKTVISRMKDNYALLSNQNQKLSGQIESLDDVIKKNTQEAKNALLMAGAAREKGMNTAFQIQARKSQRREKSNLTLMDLKKKMEFLSKTTNKLQEACGYIIEDTEDEVKTVEREWNMVNTGYSVMKAAKKILSGQDIERDIFNQAMEFTINDYNNKLGEIEHFMEMSKGVLDGIDLQNGVYEEEAIKKLELWSQKTDSLLLPLKTGTTVEEFINSGKNVKREGELVDVVVVETRDKYGKLLN